MKTLDEHVQNILITEEEIKEKVKVLAARIDSDYAGKEPVLLSILNGSFMFTADIMRELTIPVGINFIFASSYGSETVSSGDVKIHNVKGFDPAGKDIIIIEDIIDSGRTLSKIKARLIEEGAASVEICTFLDKPSRRLVDIKAKYTGFEVPDEFVIGYGLDFDQKYRDLPYISYLEEDDVEAL